MKVSIIIPTYNDSKYILKTLDSVTDQTMTDYEVIVVDDGSTDETKEVVENYIDGKNLNNKIRYCFQENKDQLNAIIHGLEYATGEYIFILHSDDLICEKDSLEKCVKYMDSNPDAQSIISDLTIIDGDGNITGIQKVKKYERNEYIVPLQLLWLGRNLYVDVGFHRRESYIEKNMKNYLEWNTPFWIDFSEEIEMLNVENVDFSFYKYRVFEDNYANDYMGKLNVISGELRTAVQIMKKYNIPSYKFQYFLFRIFNKLNLEYRPKFSKSEQQNKGDIIEFIVKKRFDDSFSENIYLKSLINFYKTKSDRKIELKNKISNVYFGKDVRIFNKKLLNNTLEEGYQELFEEMNKGFTTILVENEEEKNKIENVCRFLCIDAAVEKKF